MTIAAAGVPIDLLPPTVTALATQFDDRASWLAWRRGGIGASEAAAVAGLVAGARGVWAEKLGLMPAREPSLAMRRGQQFEAAILDIWQAEHARPGERMVQTPLIGLQRRDVSWVRCSPDALVIVPFDDGDVARPFGGVDAKSWDASARDQFDDATGDMPLKIRVQLHWSIATSGAAWWDVVVVFGAREAVSIRVERDDEIAGMLMDRAGAWWVRHVVGREPPPITAVDAGGAMDALRRRLGEQREEVAPATVADLEIAERLLALERIKAMADAGCKEARARLAERHGDATRLGFAGSGKRGRDLVLSTFRAPKPRAVVDWEAVARALAPVCQAIADAAPDGAQVPGLRVDAERALADLIAQHTEARQDARRFTFAPKRSPGKLLDMARAALGECAPEDAPRLAALLDRLTAAAVQKTIPTELVGQLLQPKEEADVDDGDNEDE